jgi:hypothetical protein
MEDEYHMSRSFSRALSAGVLAIGLSLPQAVEAADTPDTTDYVMSDFETATLSTPLWGFWYTFTDRNSATEVDTVYGNSYLTSFDSTGQPLLDSLFMPDVRSFPPGYSEFSTRALRFAYVLGDRKLSCGAACTYEPYVGFGIGFSTQVEYLDLTGSPGIAFWAKAESAPVVMDVSVGTVDTSTAAIGAPDYSMLVTVDTVWKQYVIPLVAGPDFAQPAWGPRKPFDATKVKGMNFGINRGANPEDTINAVLIDDLSILDWTYVEPVDPSSIRKASAASAMRLAIRREGGRVLVRLPDQYAGRSGVVEAVDASGRVRARQAFGAAIREIALDFGGAVPSGLLYRVRTSAR